MLHSTFLPLSPLSCVIEQFLACFLSVLFLYRCDIFHYFLLSFFPPPIDIFTRLTFEYRFCVYLCGYIVLLIFVLSLYSTYEENRWPLTFWTWITSHKMIFSSSIHLLVEDKNFILLYGQIKFHYIYHIFFICSPVLGYLGYFHSYFT
jgi:hypothetical protein